MRTCVLYFAVILLFYIPVMADQDDLAIVEKSYGNQKMRIFRVFRYPDRHEFKEVTVNIALDGDINKAWTEGDNSRIIPTDTMKNTVYAIAKNHLAGAIEKFAMALTGHFLDTHSQFSQATVKITETLWKPMPVNDASGNKKVQHPYTFELASTDKRTCLVVRTRDKVTISAGIEGLEILKTKGSSFQNFVKDKFTTIQPSKDRLLGSEISAQWTYAGTDADFDHCYNAVRDILVENFARHDESQSLQHTLYVMGKAAMKRPELAEIHLQMPHKGYVLMNLQAFKMENKNEIFVPLQEPYGYASVTIKRAEKQ